jgi:hypothetical protein
MLTDIRITLGAVCITFGSLWHMGFGVGTQVQ